MIFLLSGIIALFLDKDSDAYKNLKFIHTILAYCYMIAALIAALVMIIIASITY